MWQECSSKVGEVLLAAPNNIKGRTKE